MGLRIVLKPVKIKVPAFDAYSDAWHIANTLMIVSFVSLFVFGTHQYKWWVELIAAGTIFNLTFSLFYNKILRK